MIDDVDDDDDVSMIVLFQECLTSSQFTGTSTPTRSERHFVKLDLSSLKGMKSNHNNGKHWL